MSRAHSSPTSDLPHPASDIAPPPVRHHASTRQPDSSLPTPHSPLASSRPPLFRLDPLAGWLFLIAGLAIVACTILIPAAYDLDEARWQRDKALSIERQRTQRLERYGQYLAAVQRGDDDVLLSLVGTQLNMSPIERVPLSPIIANTDILRTSASPFPALEPDALELPPRPEMHARPSLLTRLTTNDHRRLWLIAGGVLCILLGLLPAARR